MKINKRHYNSRCDLSFLLNDSLETFYWIGYLLADGCFHSKYALTVTTARIDYDHLLKYSLLCKSEISTDVKGKYRFKTKDQVVFKVSSYSTIIVPKIMEKFDIYQRKTYNPPDFSKYNFSKEQVLALIIGFIDGDGCISIGSSNNIRISIQNHSSWYNNLNFINNTIHALSNLSPSNKVNIDKRGFASLYISDEYIVKNLMKFVETNNLPVLDRKWDKVKKFQKIRKYNRIYKFINPFDKEYISNNVTKSCKEFNLNRNTVGAIIQGRYSEYKGWRIYRINSTTS